MTLTPGGRIAFGAAAAPDDAPLAKVSWVKQHRAASIAAVMAVALVVFFALRRAASGQLGWAAPTVMPLRRPRTRTRHIQ